MLYELPLSKIVMVGHRSAKGCSVSLKKPFLAAHDFDLLANFVSLAQWLTRSYVMYVKILLIFLRVTTILD